MKKYAIIVAGGLGKRMNSKILNTINTLPKQFHCLNGTPILIRSINAFYEYNKDISIILVLPKGEISTWQKLCKAHGFLIPHSITIGGNTRFHSVKNGLLLIKEDNCLIAIHDGVRPLVSEETIHRVYSEAAKHGAVIPCIKVNDSLRSLSGKTSMPLNRDQIRAVQTPQCFNNSILKKAYKQKYLKRFTDDASVVENLGKKIHLVEGNEENIKITTSSDLAIAEVFLKSK